ncbi:MAG: ABC transporter substrate-binding protein [Armatimonadota bacterium]|nr:ABC transporter substrate-binding protein [Armatimonadota bacterium]MDR7449589.1 ABC transporter substrate-binding protein [Armatimonadota bacterium]MDR7460218.1 ABC transporter substrate-binding protein [Armatimonadota bacterium]MDR7480305.1 ABC transporter substrate-binding protein [Armatimonadota bacterium]MDR7489131.1 ABC transporter substrate-binding protein [Armatimonadota bacterium]
MKRISRRRFLRYGGAGLLALSGAERLAALASAQEPTIPIGVVYPLTGALARIGASIKNAVDLAAEIVNTPHPELDPLVLARPAGLPRLRGAKLRLLWADSKGDPATGRAETERLIERERVVAVVGAYQSAVTATASLAAEAKGIPFLNPESSSPKLTERNFKWFFRTGPHDVTFTKLFFDMMEDLKKRGHRISKIAILSEDTEFGATAVGVERVFAQRYGYEVVATELYTSPPASVEAELLRIRRSGCDVIFGQNYLVDAVLITRTLKQMRWFPQGLIVHDAGWVVPDYLQTVGDDGNYVLTRVSWALGMGRRKPLVTRVNELYRQRFGTDMDETNARSFTGLLALAAAINEAGSTRPDAIRQALAGLSLPGRQLIMPWEGIEFDFRGQNRHAAGLMAQILDRQYKVVWPFSLAEADIVWPAPPWERRG